MDEVWVLGDGLRLVMVWALADGMHLFLVVECWEWVCLVRI